MDERTTIPIKTETIDDLKPYIGHTIMICFRDRIAIRKLIGITSNENIIFDDWTGISYKQLVKPLHEQPVQLYLVHNLLSCIKTYVKMEEERDN